MRSSTRGDVEPFIVMDVMEAARKAEAEGRHVIHMEVGQPGTGAPEAARAKLAAELTEPLGYTVGLGLPELRARIAKHYANWYGVTINPERVVVTSGASGAFLLAFSALFDNGEKVGLGLPCYPSYRQILKAVGLQPVEIKTTAQTRYQPQPKDVAGLDGLIVASPANPTGTMLNADEMRALADACDVYVVNSFSKYFSMTGWRVGWMIVPEDHVRRVERLAQNMFICAPHASQRLALHAMDCGAELDENLAVYAKNRTLMLDGLKAAGFDNAVTPGLDFDAVDGHRWIRLSYARSTEDISEGLTRLSAFMAERTS